MAFGIQSFFRKRALVVYAVIVLLLVAGVVVFYQVANARGARALEESQAYLASHGEDLELADLMPDSISDEENFFATPTLLDIGREEEGYPDWANHLKRQRRLKEMDPGRERGGDPWPWKGYGSEEGVALNFERWLTFVDKHGTFDSESVPADGPAPERFLAAFEAAHGDVFEELGQALAKPGARITPLVEARIAEVGLATIKVSWAQPLQSLAKVLRTRAAAAAQCSDAQTARESVEILLKLSEGAHQEVSTLSKLIALAIDSIASTAIWECINAGVLDDAALAHIQERLEAVDYVETYRQIARANMLWGREWISGFREALSGSGMDEFVGSAGTSIWRVAPAGWFDQNVAQLNRWTLEYRLLPANKGLLECIHAADRLEAQIASVRNDNLGDVHRIWASHILQSTGAMAKFAVRQESLRVRTVTACALERFRLAHAEYPERLELLVPQYLSGLPVDVCRADGEPLGYRREAGRYVLWSVALDGIDHNGKSGGARSRSSSSYPGDWAWRFDGVEPPLPTAKKKRSKKRRKSAPGP